MLVQRELGNSKFNFKYRTLTLTKIEKILHCGKFDIKQSIISLIFGRAEQIDAYTSIMSERIPAKDILCLTSLHRGYISSQQIVYQGECIIKQHFR